MLNLRTVWILLSFQLSCLALDPAPPWDIVPVSLESSKITNRVVTLDNQTKTIGLRDALDSRFSSTNRSITVFLDACKQSDGTPNCTAACQDPTQRFSDLKTLHNCAAFPEISALLANNNISANARRLAEDLRIELSSDDSSLPSNISNSIQQCLYDSYPQNLRFSRTLKPIYSTSEEDLPNNLTDIFIRNSRLLCTSIPAYVDSDVGGIGVFISYIMQMGLALLAFLVTIPWPSIIKRLRTSFDYFFGVLSRRRETSKAKQRARESVAQTNREHLVALTSALVGFQKAQCWFMLATNIAGLIVMKYGGLEPRSLQKLYNTYIFIKVIAIGGYLPITFTLLNLHLIKSLAWYPIILSIITIAVATTTLKMGGTTFVASIEDFDHINSVPSGNGPPSCAHQDLTPWCYDPRSHGNYFGFDASSSGSGANNILIFCLITLAIIILDHFCRSDDRNQQKINHWILQKLGITTSKPLFPRAGEILHYGTIAFHFIFFGLYIYCFYIFGEDLQWFNSNNVFDPSWSFGQIVAILVWAPTVVDYLWDQTRGIEKGSEHKLPRMYEVVKRAQERNTAESTFASSSTTSNLDKSNNIGAKV